MSNDITGGKNNRISAEMKKSNSKFNACLDTLDSDDNMLIRPTAFSLSVSS